MALGLSRECVESALTQLGFDVRVRGEVLQVADFIGLANIYTPKTSLWLA